MQRPAPSQVDAMVALTPRGRCAQVLDLRSPCYGVSCEIKKEVMPGGHTFSAFRTRAFEFSPFDQAVRQAVGSTHIFASCFDTNVCISRGCDGRVMLVALSDGNLLYQPYECLFFLKWTR